MVKTKFKDSSLNLDDIEHINYKDIEYLDNFISVYGKILPRRITGLNSKQQKRIAKLIKRARIASFLPFINGKIR
jgi:small subunit ribosomal protein S18